MRTRIVRSPGPLVSVQMVVGLYPNSRERPDKTAVAKTLTTMVTDGFGLQKTVARNPVFFKIPPEDIDEQLLGLIELSRDEYEEMYKDMPSESVIKAEKFRQFVQGAPAEYHAKLAIHGFLPQENLENNG